ncbi:MAG TPA: hypothetical protein VJA66_14335 [Thermoanaerobaculia bacterium]
MGVPANIASLHERFRSALTKRYFVRLHMTVMILLVLLSGLIASRLLLLAGISHMGIRYPLAVLVSYVVFFVLIRIWIGYVSRASRRSKGSGIDVGDFVPNGSGSFSGGSAKAVGQLAEGGGRFGGGGASASFVEGETAAARPVVPLIPARQSAGSGSSGSSGSKSSSGFGLDLDGDGVWLLVLFVLLVAAIFGAGLYLVYQAPVILSEAAFHTALASGLVRTARNAHDPGWVESVLKSTILPFALVLVLAGVFGYQAHKRCPGAVTVRQVFRQCIFRR